MLAQTMQDDPARDVYAIDPLRKVVLHQLGLGKHASAMRTWDRLSQVYTRLKQVNCSARKIGRSTSNTRLNCSPTTTGRLFFRESCCC